MAEENKIEYMRLLRDFNCGPQHHEGDIIAIQGLPYTGEYYIKHGLGQKATADAFKKQEAEKAEKAKKAEKSGK